MIDDQKANPQTPKHDKQQEVIYIDPDRPPTCESDLRKIKNQNKSKAKK